MSMETYSNRASSLFTTFTTVLFVVACLNHFTSYFYSADPHGEIKVNTDSTIEYSEYKTYKADQARFNFDLSVDLTSEMNWNVNQIYLFVVASYETKKNKKNEVVIYDRILRSVDEFKFGMKNAKVKYPLRDEHTSTLAGKTVTLAIRYQVMPIFGLMRVSELPNKATLEIPSEYTSSGQTKNKKK
jgi:signal peptidase complex subunit 3